jgi:hypothetical protein
MSDEKIEIKTETEKPKKANKILLAISVFLLASVLGYFMMPSDSTPTKQQDEVTSTGQTGNTISAQLKEEQEKQHQHKANPTVTDQDGVTQQVTANQVQQGHSVAEPAPLTPREQFEAKQEQEAWAREAQNKLKAEDNQIKANQSGIFITLPSQNSKKNNDTKDTNKRNQSVNEYYNATSNSDYIRVVSGDNKERSQRSER